MFHGPRVLNRQFIAFPSAWALASNFDMAKSVSPTSSASHGSSVVSLGISSTKFSMRMPLCLLVILLGSASASADDSGKSAEYIKYEKMAEEGDGDAMVTIGVYYHQGEGVKQDYAKAAEWYRKAIAVGNADAFSNLGVLFRDGSGVPQNRKLAYLIFLAIHMEGIGDEQTQIRAGRNLEKLIEMTSESERAEALSYTWAYVVQLFMSLGVDTEIRESVLPTTEQPRIRDNDWWLDSERAQMTFVSPPPWDKIKDTKQPVETTQPSTSQ